MSGILSLDRIKLDLGISGSSKDRFLVVLAKTINGYIETYTGVKIISRKFTEYPVLPTRKCRTRVYLQNYPVHSIESVNVNTEYKFLTENNLSSSNYKFEKDIGRLTLLGGNAFSTRELANKVVYWAGMSSFEIREDVNDTLHVTYNSNDYNVILTPGVYVAETLISHLNTAIPAAIPGTTIVASYSHRTQRFKFAAASAFKLNFHEKEDSCCDILGYDYRQFEGNTTYTADFQRTGVPEDLVGAASRWFQLLYAESGAGKGQLTIKSEGALSSRTQTTYIKEIPEDVRMILETYQRIV